MNSKSPMPSFGHSTTPILADSGYHVHDGLRPQPPIVTPGGSGKPPSDATMLFAGGNLSLWESIKGGDAPWKVESDFMEVVPSSGNIRTKAQFGTAQFHLEFASPSEVVGSSQQRGNSGIFLMGLYEIQVLDNYENPTYADGIVGAIYGQCPPLVNAIRKPGEWNTCDILWEAPVFEGQKLVSPAYLTLFLNGIVLHNHKALHGPTQHKALAEYTPHPPTGPLMLQDHRDLVRFRNIWVREIGHYDQVASG